jgi:hypothetical protein
MKNTRVVRIDGKSYRPTRVVRLPAPPDPQFSGRPICYVPRGVAVVNNKVFDRKQIARLANNVRELMAYGDSRAADQNRKLALLCRAFEERYGERA